MQAPSRRVLFAGIDFGYDNAVKAHGGWLASLWTPRSRFDEIFVGMHGRHQLENVSMALCATEELLGHQLPESIVKQVCDDFQSPGRLEVVDHDPLIIVDSAHNAAAAARLADSIAEEFDDRPRVWVIALLAPRDPGDFLAALGIRPGDRLIATQVGVSRAVPATEIIAAAKRLGLSAPALSACDPSDLYSSVFANVGHDGMCVFAGSVYLAGIALKTFG